MPGWTSAACCRGSYIGINEMLTQVAALSEVARILAASQGADPDAVAKAVPRRIGGEAGRLEAVGLCRVTQCQLSCR